MRERKGIREKNRRWNVGVLLMLPSLIGTCVFCVVPFLDVVRISFFKIISGEFAGIDNYVEVLHNPAFRLATRHTLSFWGIGITLQIGGAFLIARALTGKERKYGWIKSVGLLPMVVPVACVAMFWEIFFDANGILNALVHAAGGDTADWLNSKAAFGVLIISYLWRNVGYDEVLWSARLAAIPREQYEAAKVDGAGKWMCFRYITAPNMKTTLFLIVVLSLLNSFKIFREAYLVAGEYPHESIYMIQHLYNNWYRGFAFDKIAAASVLHFLVILVLVLLLQKIWNREE